MPFHIPTISSWDFQLHHFFFFFFKNLALCFSLMLYCILFVRYMAFKFIYLFIYFWLCWVFVSVWGLSLVAASGGHSSSRCAGLSLSRPLWLRSTGSRRTGSVVVAHGPSCSAACGIFLDQGSNPCPLHWQADSQPLRHQGSPTSLLWSDFLMLAMVVDVQWHLNGLHLHFPNDNDTDHLFMCYLPIVHIFCEVSANNFAHFHCDFFIEE